MAPGLPEHLAPRAVSRTFARALHAPAFVLLAGCLVASVTLQAQTPGVTLWPAIAAAAVMLACLAVLDRWRTPLFSILYLLIGGLSAYAYIRTLALEFDADRLSDNFIVVMPAAALIMVGGSGAGAVTGLRWCTAGFVVAQSVAFLAVLETRDEMSVSLTPVAVYVGIVLVLSLLWFGRRADWRAQPRLGAAERAEYFAAVRRRAEVEAAALTHDTILNDLTVIATSPTGPPSAELYDQLELDLAALKKVDLATLDPSTPSEPVPAEPALAEPMSDEPAWAAPVPAGVTRDSSTPEPPLRLPTAVPDRELAPHQYTRDLVFPRSWQSTPLFGAVRAARERGLTVMRTGNPAPVAQLGEDAAAALGLAVTACLSNVEKHSGVTEAEVAIDASDTDLVVLVIDAGSGFDPADVPADRLGIKSSVRGRIEAAHGTVAVWSSPGSGTSVILRLPLQPAAAR